MSNVKSLHPRSADELASRRRDKRHAEFAAIRARLPRARHGFSARLSLLCGLAGERELSAGRVEDIAALCDSWDPADVQAWLTQDRLPSPDNLLALVTFLVARLPEGADSEAWMAYLVFGEERCPRPTRELIAATPDDLLPLASRVLTALVRDYRVEPESYDPELLLQRVAALLADLNVSAHSTELQPGHARLIALQLFPDANHS